MATHSMIWGAHALPVGSRTIVMGIVNVTPDSFSDGGRFYEFEKAVARAEQMAAEGADIIDIGGESTRPYAADVSAEEELRRVVPVIEYLAPKIRIPISIDTAKAEVARRALAAGASMINDISALNHDPDMAEVAAESGVPLILMHMKGTPRTMQQSPHYDDLPGEIMDFLNSAVERAIRSGVDREKIIIDPGIGFGKTFDHNLSLLKHLGKFKEPGLPLLVGASRKAFIRNLLKGKGQKDIPADLPVVETGSQAAVSVAILHGADIVRVHNVADTCATARIVDAILRAA